MSDENNLVGQLRTEFGKGYARRARMAGQIPAVIYGHGAEPLHITLPELATARVARHANALVTVTVDGKEHMALIKDVQKNPVRQNLEHLDLLTVRKGEKVTVDVPVVVVGEPGPGAVANQEANTLTIEAEATHLPSSLEVDITDREMENHVLASDVQLPKGSTLLSDPETLVVNIADKAAAAAAAEAAEAAEAEAAAADSAEAPEAEAEEETASE